jgi:MFS family permease
VNRWFWLFLVGQAQSTLGDAFANVAMGWLVYDLTHSLVAMGSLYAVGLIPEIIIRLVGAPLVDRFNRSRFMALLDLIRFVAYGIPPLLALTGHLSLWHLYALSAVAGMARSLFWPAYAALVPSLVEEPQLMRANSLIEGTTQVMLLGGPAIAGFVVAHLGGHLALTLNAVTFAISGLTLGLLPAAVGVPKGQPKKSSRYLTQLLEGFQFFRRAPALQVLLLMIATANMGDIAVQSLLVPYVREQLGAGATTVGVITSALAVGGVVGTAIMTAVGTVKRRRALVAGSLAAAGLAWVGLSLVQPGQAYVAVALQALVGLAATAYGITSHYIYQQLVPDYLRGRVQAIRMVIAWSASPLGGFLGGLLAARAGIPATFLTAGLLLATVCMLAFFTPALRGIDGELAPLEVAS